MKLTGNKLKAALAAQREAVTLVCADGREYHNVSPRWAAEKTAGTVFIGFANNGVVSKIVAAGAPRPAPFATHHDVAAIMADFRRIPHGTKTADRGLKWTPQPVFSNTGRTSKVSTIHFG